MFPWFFGWFFSHQRCQGIAAGIEALHWGRLCFLLGRHGTGEGWPCLGPSQLRADAGTTGGMGCDGEGRGGWARMGWEGQRWWISWNKIGGCLMTYCFCLNDFCLMKHPFGICTGILIGWIHRWDGLSSTDRVHLESRLLVFYLWAGGARAVIDEVILI